MALAEKQITQVKIRVDNIEDFVPIGNRVLLKVEHSTDRMNNGLLVGDKEFKPADHAERIYKVVNVPKQLNPNLATLHWETDVEIRKGDIVLTDYLDSINGQRYCDGNGEGDYRFFNYSDIYARIIQDGDDYILEPINGYVICKKVYETLKLGVYEKELLVQSQGVVKYISKPNKAYLRQDWSDDGIDISVGDKIKIFPINYSEDQIDLEYQYHSILKEKLFILQRRRIAGVIE